MVRRHYNLPPMTTLVAFEAAARHSSFKAAADELNVTPGAVSHQIKALEEALGVGLFVRVHRGVALSDEGRELFTAIRGAFSTMAGAVERLRQQDQGRALTIGATTAMAALWLTPRITRFWREHPEVAINQILSDSPAGTGPKPDLRLVYGRERGESVVNDRLFRDSLVPLAAPGLAAARGLENGVPAGPEGLAVLAGLPLIHLNAEGQDWTTWAEWFAALGHRGPLSRGMRVNNYMIALQAAQDGAGAVLGWRRLVTPFLRSGALQVLGDFSLPAPMGFHIARTSRGPQHPAADLVRRWLLEDAASSDEFISSKG